MKDQPKPGGLHDPCAPANDADDSAPADAALAAVLVHGLKPAQVVLAGHDPRWARRFTARATELRRVLGERARRLVEHVGSTAVPGLPAKPVVDILVGIDDPDDEAAYLPDLEAAGYDLTVREPQHRCLRAGDPGEPVNLHCYPPGHPETRKLLLFRDHRRRNARDRRRYEAPAAAQRLPRRQPPPEPAVMSALYPVTGRLNSGPESAGAYTR